MGVHKIFRGSNLGAMLMGSVSKSASSILTGEYFYTLKISKEMTCYFFFTSGKTAVKTNVAFNSNGVVDKGCPDSMFLSVLS